MILPWRPVSINGGPPISTSLTSAEAQALTDLARGRMVLEIGSAYGYSAILMAQAAQGVVTIDPHQGHGAVSGSLNTLRGNLAAYRASNVTALIGRSDTQMRWLIDAGTAFGLIFIDGDHRREAVTRDLQLARQLVAPGGTIACHDYGESTCPDVTAVIDEAASRDRFPGGTRLVDTLWIWERA